MRCPFCGCDDSQVLETRTETEGIRRRRRCTQCTRRFSTFETVELRFPMIIKSDSSREPFDERKLRRGLESALYKRPISIHKIDTICNNIKQLMIQSGEREISSRQIGQWAIEQLKNTDAVAYIRFSSVYQNFENVEAFRRSLETVQN